MGTLIVLTFFFVIVPMRALFSTVEWLAKRLSIPDAWKRRWKRLDQKRKKFWIYVVFGTACVLLAQVLSPRIGFLNSMTEAFGFDLLNKLEFVDFTRRYLRIKRERPKNELKYAAVLVDDSAQADWGNPSKVPRKKLKALIDAVLKFNPRLVIVDLDLAFDANDQDNQALFAYLDHHARTSSVPIILMRGYRFLEVGNRSYRVRIPTPFDRIYPEGAVWWASPVLPMDKDKIIRGFLAAQMVCRRDKGGIHSPELLPGVSVMADMLLSSSKDEWSKLRSELKRKGAFGLDACRVGAFGWQEDEMGHSRYLDVGGKRWRLKALRNDNRVVYSLSPGVSPLEKLSTPVPANDLLTGAPIAEDVLHDRIVVIGTSHRNSRDNHLTSVAEMEGYLILLNGIETLHSVGQIRNLGVIAKIVSTLLVVFLFSWIASRYSAVTGMIVSSAVVVIVLLPLGMWLYPQGLWFNFGVPLIAIQGNQIVGELTQMIMSRSRHD